MRHFMFGVAVGAMALAVAGHGFRGPTEIGERQEATVTPLDSEADRGVCAGDLDDSGAVDVFDLLALLGNWGSCAECVDDNDCGPGEVCTNGVCFPTSCVSHNECPPGHYCDNGTCVPQLPKGAACTDSAQCMDGLSCHNGFCAE